MRCKARDAHRATLQIARTDIYSALPNGHYGNPLDTVPIWAQILALVMLICCSAFFSISETALIALNSYRVKHLAKGGSKRALVTLWLLERTDRLLSLVLIAQTLLNALVTALVTAIAIESFGSNQKVLTIATGTIAFLLIVFAEITPKIIGATNPDRIALRASPILKPIMIMVTPAIWFVNLFVNLILRMLGIKTGADAHR
jgi:Mg2+/Co2+ transporter CorB